MSESERELRVMVPYPLHFINRAEHIKLLSFSFEGSVSHFMIRIRSKDRQLSSALCHLNG